MPTQLQEEQRLASGAFGRGRAGLNIALCVLAKAPMAVILKLVITALDPALRTICLKSEMRPPKIET